MKEQTESYFDMERYIALLFDEMKIKSNLVFDRVTGELIGFTDLGDPSLNYGTIEEESIASHILVFLLRGLCTNLKFPFATKNVTSHQTMSLFWEAVFILEKNCNLWLLTATEDGASTNSYFFRMHEGLDDEITDSEFCYRTINIWTRYQYIYFLSGVPHLIKTLRNCLFHSSFGESSRLLWNNVRYLLSEHISRIYYMDC